MAVCRRQGLSEFGEFARSKMCIAATSIFRIVIAAEYPKSLYFKKVPIVLVF